MKFVYTNCKKKYINCKVPNVADERGSCNAKKKKREGEREGGRDLQRI